MQSSQSAFQGIVQVAGVHDAAEAEMLATAGVDWIGFPLRLPVHRPDSNAAAVAAIVRGLTSRVTPVLITYLSLAAEIEELCRELGVRHVQLHGDIAVEELRRLRKRYDGLFVIKSLVVRDGNASALADMVQRLSPHVEAFITDTFDPATGACGATGRAHDWGVSRGLVERSPRPVILAGGLTPENVAAAVRAVRPAGVDVHTGVEGRDGRKDPRRVLGFVTAARQAFDGP